MKDYFVYIMASESGTLYVGMTNNLNRRVWEHKNGIIDGFTKKYGCHKLVYYDIGQDVNGTIAREKQIKNWNRKKKEKLIKINNPKWEDLSREMFGY